MAFVRVVFGEFASRIGWFLLLAGLIMPGMQAFDSLTATEATATVTEVRTVCSKQVASKSWRKFPCSQRAEVEAAGKSVRTQGWAKLAFSAPNGAAITGWANFDKLDISQAEVGQELAILYRGNKSPYVTRPFNWLHAAGGFSVSFAGLVLLLIVRRVNRAVSDVATVPPHPAERPLPSPAPKPWSILDQATAISGSQAIPHPAYTAPSRQSSVQRNRGWFG